MRAPSPGAPPARGRGLAAPLALFLVLALVGCTANRPPDRVAFSSLETIKATAESVMRVHASLWAQGLSTPERRAKVDAAYEAVRVSCTTAALGLSAVKTWADVAGVLAGPEKELGTLKSLVPEFKE